MHKLWGQHESNKFSTSRRSLLKTMGLGALGVGLTGIGKNVPESLAKAPLWQTTPTMATPAGFYRFMVGDLQVTAIQDGVATFDVSVFGVNTAPEDVYAVLEDNNLPGPKGNASITLLLVENGEERTLLDSGLGGFPFGELPPNSGKIVPTLELLGIAPDMINHVFLSHFHIDHLGGLLNGGMPTFPNAMHHISQAEMDFLNSGQTDVPGAEFIEQAKTQLQPLIDNDQLQFMGDEAEIASGVQALAASGHTPGHMTVLLASAGQQLMCLVDTANHPVISLAHPEWHFIFDAEPEVAVETRRTLLNRAVDERMQVLAYHYPFPGAGFVDRDGDGFRFLGAI